jgi:5-methylthioadenosine/S-adenosylhomocysteine deaminase
MTVMTNSTPTPVDLLIEAAWIVPIEPAGTTLADHAVVIHDGAIVDLLPQTVAQQRYRPATVTRLPQHVLLPGLINLHTHAAMTLLRGLADDLPLMDWLQNHIWPAEGAHVSPQFVADGTRLACAEMLAGGITCFNDMYFYPEAAIEAALGAGMRIAAGIVTLEFPTPYASDAGDYLDKGLASRDRYRGEPLASFCLAPHAPYTVSDASFERIVTLAEQLAIPIHLHIHETADELAGSLREHGLRPLARLDRLGLLGPAFIGVHAVHVDDAEIALLARHGASIAHCPTSNLKLGSGIAPVARMHAQGLNIGLGSDGAASNNRLDLWQEMRLAALLAKGDSGDATAIGAHSALAMATLNGARALGLDHRIGSLTPGKRADLCAVRINHVAQQPCYDIASHLVYVCGREHVSDVWVDGVARIVDGRRKPFDDEELLQCAYSWQNKVSSRH